jgi:hypothetical protein
MNKIQTGYLAQTAANKIRIMIRKGAFRKGATVAQPSTKDIEEMFYVMRML